MRRESRKPGQLALKLDILLPGRSRQWQSTVDDGEGDGWHTKYEELNSGEGVRVGVDAWDTC